MGAIAVQFLILDGAAKVMKESHGIAASATMGYLANAIVRTGIALFVCVAHDVISRTSLLGAILLTDHRG